MARIDQTQVPEQPVSASKGFRWLFPVLLVAVMAAAVAGPRAVGSYLETRVYQAQGSEAQSEWRGIGVEVAGTRRALIRTLGIESLGSTQNLSGSSLVQTVYVGGDGSSSSVPLESRVEDLLVDLGGRLKYNGHPLVAAQIVGDSASKGTLVLARVDASIPEGTAFQVSPASFWVPREEGAACTLWLPDGPKDLAKKQAQSWSNHRLEPVLTSCLMVLAFGSPGPEVADWYANHGHWFSRDIEPREDSDLSREMEPSWFGRRELWRTTTQTLGCAKQVPEACRGLALGDQQLAWREDPTVPGHSFQRYMSFGRSGDPVGLRAALWELLREEGTDRFTAFWTSEEPVEIAFEDAFGKSMESWMGSEMHRWTTATAGGPNPNGWGWAVGLLTAAVFLGGGVARAKGVQV